MIRLASVAWVVLGMAGVALLGCPRSERSSAAASATSAPPPVVTLAAPAPHSAPPMASSASHPAVEPAATGAPTWRGDPCEHDTDCAFDDPCVPVRCGANGERAPARCDEPMAAPGRCRCVEGMCTLERYRPAEGASDMAACLDDRDCAVDVATATCHPHGKTLIGPIEREGPVCVCRPSMGQCQLIWQEPIACDSWRDCSWTHTPRLRPVPATELPRPLGRPVRPCEDGPVDSICEPHGNRKICRIVGWRC